MKNKSISKSTFIMFFFDLIVLLSITYFSIIFCNLQIGNILSLICILFVATTGLITNYLKGNYKIREFNPSFWNFYRMFEGMIFTHVPIGILLFFFVDKSTLIKFLGINVLIIYFILCIYRFCFHYYLFYIKKIKNILILGTDERAKIIADEIQSKAALKMKVVGFVQDDFSEEIIPDSNVSVYSKPESLKHIICDNKIDIVIITQPTELILTIPRDIKIYKMPEPFDFTRTSGI